MSRFASFIGAQQPCKPTLPLTHTTDGFTFRDLVSLPKLKLANCKVYEELLLYLFYGRPAYRSHSKRRSISLKSFTLVSFILDPASMPAPKRVVAFDSGAMANSIYESHMHPDMTKEHFELVAQIEEAAKLVGFYFGTNAQYFAGLAKPGLDIPPLQMEAESFYSLISATHETDSDDRRGTVELQYDTEIDLLSSSVLAVVLPEAFLDDPAVTDFIQNRLAAEAIGYSSFHARPLEDTRSIMDKTKDFLSRRKLI